MNNSPFSLRIKLSIFCFVSILLCTGVLLLKNQYTQDTKHGLPKKVRKVRINYETANPFEIYEALRKKILSHNLKPKDLNAFRTIVKNDSELKNIYKTFDFLSGEDTRDEMYITLYRQFIKASPDPDILYHYLNEELFKILKKAEKNEEKQGNIYAWSWSHGARAAILAYKASKEERFLDLMVSTYNIILKNRDSERNKIDEIRGRALHSWGSSNKDYTKNIWANGITAAGMITYPVSMFCKIVFDNKELHAEYLDSAKRFLYSIELAIAEFNENFKIIPGTDEGYYKGPTDDIVEPLNHAHAAGNTLVMLYIITQKDHYREKAEQLARFYLSSVRRQENGSYIWGYQPTPQDRITKTIEPVWKGAITITFPLLAYQNGIVFNADDIKALENTFLKNIYRGNNIFNSNISSGSKFKRLDYIDPSLKSRAKNLALWIFLDEYAPQIRTIIENMVIEKKEIFKKGWFHDTKMALAYSHRFRSLQ